MKPELPRAALFDLDGTLIDSKGDIAAACNAALASVGGSPLPVDVIASFVGDGSAKLVARALGRDVDDALTRAALAEFNAYYEAHPVVHTTIAPGAIEALTRSARSPRRS